MGTGDWNDGMNRVGAAGRGESVWLGWFLHRTLSDFADLATCRGDTGFVARALTTTDGSWNKPSNATAGTATGTGEHSSMTDNPSGQHRTRSADWAHTHRPELGRAQWGGRTVPGCGSDGRGGRPTRHTSRQHRPPLHAAVRTIRP